MKILIRKLMLMGLALSFASGCGENGSSYSLLSEVDTFKQTDGTFNTKIDILWVIDNSGSMETSQQSLINNLNSFMSDFINKNLDFKMAVTTTDAYRDKITGLNKCSVFRDGLLNYDCNPISSKTYTGVRVMDRFTPNLLTVFGVNSLLTDTANLQNLYYGHGDERAFQSIQAALDQPLNAGFIRPNSFLSVVILSDEDDFSHSGSTLNESYTNPALYPVSQYVSYLDTLTGSQPENRRYNVNAIAIFDTACRDFLNTQNFTGRKVGNRYGQLIDSVNSNFTVNELKGIKGSLCGNFADDLKKIADNTLTLASRFNLARLPIPATITVKVNGITIPNKDTNPLNNGGWVYEASTNSILFVGSAYIPQAGSSIVVNYDPQAYGS